MTIAIVAVLAALIVALLYLRASTRQLAITRNIAKEWAETDAETIRQLREWLETVKRQLYESAAENEGLRKQMERWHDQAPPQAKWATLEELMAEGALGDLEGKDKSPAFSKADEHFENSYFACKERPLPEPPPTKVYTMKRKGADMLWQGPDFRTPEQHDFDEKVAVAKLGMDCAVLHTAGCDCRATYLQFRRLARIPAHQELA